MINPRSKNCIRLSTNSRTQPTMVEEQRCTATTPNAQAAPEQQQQWEHLQEFHVSIPLWPTDISAQGIEGGSPLIWTMLYPLSKATRTSTYAWNGHWNTTSGTNVPNHLVTERIPCLSQSRWSSRMDSSWVNPPTSANLLRNTHRLPALAKTTKTWYSPEITPTFQQSLPPQQQWEHMRAFHSNTLLWPTKERIGQTQVEGGSPLTWMMLHPPLADTQLQTYVWNRHLANYMPWTIDQATDRPPIILHAR